MPLGGAGEQRTGVRAVGGGAGHCRSGGCIGGLGRQGQMSEGKATRYLIDHQGLVWFEQEQREIVVKHPLVQAVLRLLIADLFALVDCQHGRPGVSSTLALLCDPFHSPGMCRNGRGHIMSCGSRRS